MNCTAWRLRPGEGADRRAERGARQGVERRDQEEQPQRAADVEPDSGQRDHRDDAHLGDRGQAECQGVAGEQAQLPIGSVINRSSVPPTRSRKVVIEVMRNIMKNGKMASNCGARRSVGSSVRRRPFDDTGAEVETRQGKAQR